MKKLFLILFLASPVLAGGPKYKYKDPHLNDEIENIYKDIGHVLSYKTYKTSFSITGIVVDSITINYQALIKGTTTNDNAMTGYLGEYLSASYSGVNAGASGVFSDATSTSITPGDWIIVHQGYFVVHTNDETTTAEGFSTTSGDNDPSDYGFKKTVITHVNWNGRLIPFTVIGRLSLSSNGTLYAKIVSSYTTGSASTFTGALQAWRIR